MDQPLSWDSRNQLQETIQVERQESISDKESYLYDGQGMRVQKIRIYLAENQIHTERVRYLTGLELREHWQTDLQRQNQRTLEAFHLIFASAGDVPVKVLYWETGQPDAITENNIITYSLSDQLGSNQIELNKIGELVSFESYYPYGGTAIWATNNQAEAHYKYRRYSGKEHDHSGLYYYGYRYYMPWLGRWLNPDPSGIADGLNLFCMVHNNPITFLDADGMVPVEPESMHLAEERLRSQLPEIINIARNQVSGALKALRPQGVLKKSIPKKYLEIVEEFLGNASKQSIEDLRTELEAIKAGLERITPQSFNIKEELYELGGGTAYVSRDTIRKFQEGSPATIDIAYMRTGRAHLEDIATTVVHEVSHLVRDTKDKKYSLLYKVSEKFDVVLLAPLHEYAMEKTSKPLENADTLARLTSVLYYAFSDKKEHKLLYEKYLESKQADDPRARGVLAYHQLESVNAPRISTPEMERRSKQFMIAEGVFKVGNHIMI